MDLINSFKARQEAISEVASKKNARVVYEQESAMEEVRPMSTSADVFPFNVGVVFAGV